MADVEKNLLGDRFTEAFAYAARLHAAQRRKAKKTPYVAHLMAVSSMVLECGGDEDAAMAALLHDAAEDQGGPGKSVRKGFWRVWSMRPRVAVW